MSAENKKTILLVEDELTTARGEKRILEKFGYEVIVANSGEEAVATVKKTPDIDLILMDINLGGGIDGTEAAAIILQQRDIPVVFLSSHTEPEIVEKTEKITSYGYIVKASGNTVLDASIKMAFKLFEADATLHKSEEAYRNLFEHSLDGIIIVVEMRIVRANRAFCSMHGLAAEFLLGTNPLELIDPRDRDLAAQRIRAFSENANVSAAQIYRAQRHDGSSIWVDVRSRHIRWQGKPGLLAIIRDITERKQAEKEIKRQLAEKEILLREVHHRIKNNIASIGGLLSLHMQSISNPEAVAVLQEAIGRVNSMRILYDKLLFSEDFKEISVKNYLDDLINTIVTIFPDKAKIKLEKRIDGFQLDAKRLFPLGIIINELLTNKMKYAFINRDSGLIKISLKKVKNHVTLYIQDNGNELPDGFELDKTKGFGLVLVKMLSQQLGGSFSLEKHKGTPCKVEFDI